MARNFVRNRLRFVDAIHRPWVPVLAGALAFLFAWPLALLPLVSAAPAVVFGIGIGLGTPPREPGSSAETDVTPPADHSLRCKLMRLRRRRP